jgi:hypothetical protein
MKTRGWSGLGLVAGGFVGFLLRPGVPLLGTKLPFGVVITRGAALTGFDQLLVPLAQSSFDYLLAGAVIGGVVGLVIGQLPGAR